jgi:hypothetical protein
MVEATIAQAWEGVRRLCPDKGEKDWDEFLSQPANAAT